MLIRITNHCTMGCSHCFTESTPKGEHMTRDTFVKAMTLAKALGDPMFLISGGEPTDHPEVVEFLRMAMHMGSHTSLLSNGMWLTDPKFDPKARQEILDTVDVIQVTNDDRYYPRRIEQVKHPKIGYETRIRQVSPFGRAKTNGIESARQSPLCFNLRSFARSFKSLPAAIMSQRLRGSFCTPTISVNGDVLAGESTSCGAIGTVYDSIETLNAGIIGLKCNRCGLVDGLPPTHKQAIGEI